MRLRPTFAALALTGLLLSACGSADAEPVADTWPSGDEPAEPADDGADAAADGAAADEGSDAASEPAADPATDEVPPRSGVETPADPATGKPSVALPADSPTELVAFDVIEGEGEPAEVGDIVEVSYVGVLTADGTEFDNSYDSGRTFEVQLGAGQVIPGWDQGLVGVKAGGRRQLDIPPVLAYGERGAGGVIPPNAAISFVVDVVAVTKPTPPPTLAPAIDEAACPPEDGSAEQRQEFDEYPPTCIDPTAVYLAEVVTNFGTLVIELDPARAPLTVNSFVTLARYHYFDGTECHRAIPGFVVQCGDPTATGTGGPGYRFPDELPAAGDYTIGSVAMANSGPDTNGSQFFIITGDSGAALPPNYALFGQVVEGLDTTVVALDAVANPDGNGVPPLEQILIESVTIIES